MMTIRKILNAKGNTSGTVESENLGGLRCLRLQKVNINRGLSEKQLSEK